MARWDPDSPEPFSLWGWLKSLFRSGTRTGTSITIETEGHVPPAVRRDLQRANRTGKRRSRRSVVRSSESQSVQEYTSLEDMPPDLRRRVEEMMARGGSHTSQTYTYRDPDGVEHTYHSLDEMPDDVRRHFERFR